MILGRVASVHINERAIRIAEAIVERGIIKIENAFEISNVDRFFSKGKLINLSMLVETITLSMSANGVTAKRLELCFDNVFQTSFSIEPLDAESMKKRTSFFKKKSAKTQKVKGDHEDDSVATIVHHHSWGTYITQDEQGEAISTVMAERDMVTSLVTEFRRAGYTVCSIEPPDTALVYVKNTLEYTYDSLQKICIHADNEEIGDLYIFTKDVPSTIKRIQFDTLDGSTFRDKICELCEREISIGQMRNPYVYLIGDAFEDIDLYTQIAEDLEYEGIQVIDLYGLGQDYSQYPHAIQVQLSEAAKDNGIELTCQFGLCICLFLRCFDPKPENLKEGGSYFAIVAPRVRIKAVKVLCALASAFLFVNVMMAGAVFYESVTLSNMLDDSATIKTELVSIQNQCSAAETQLSVINSLDDRLEGVFDFVYANVDASINIASVDTEDMIPVNTGSQNATSEGSEVKEEGSASQVQQQTNSEKSESQETKDETASATESTDDVLTNVNQQIVIRGYSAKSNGPIDLYNALDQAGLGIVKLVGQQQMDLPSGETIYAFELRIE